MRDVLAAGGELDLLDWGEGASRPLERVTHHRAAPFAEEEIAAELGGEAGLQVAESAGGSSAAENCQWRQGLVGALGVEIRIAEIRAEEAVIDAEKVIA